MFHCNPYSSSSIFFLAEIRENSERGAPLVSSLDEIFQDICFRLNVFEHRRRYGYRRISAELRRQGVRVNHKRVMRIMAEDNLLAVQRKSFVVMGGY